ncbi:MAG: tetratricopeptide repeat protein [Chloroflexi bacterium]|nr:tetratricopeptide repeat protein [Chloroflexota bacterium]
MARLNKTGITDFISRFITLWNFIALIVSLGSAAVVTGALSRFTGASWQFITIVSLFAVVVVLIAVLLVTEFIQSRSAPDDPDEPVPSAPTHVTATSTGEQSRAAASETGPAVAGDIDGGVAGRDNVTNITYAAPSTEPPSARTSWEHRPAPIGDDLVGRDDDLQEIKDGLIRHQAIILTGGPGTGKSRLAAEFTIREDLNGIWIDATEGSTRALAGLAGLFNIPQSESPDDEALASQVVRLIATLPAANLLVFDNLPGMREVGELVRRLDGRKLLITTRDSQLSAAGLASGAAAALIVEPLDTDDGIDLLARKSGKPPATTEFREITEAVGGLPLAIEAVALPIREGYEQPAESLQRLKESPDPLKLKIFQEAIGFTVDRDEGVFQALAGNIQSLPLETQRQLVSLGYIADTPVSLDLVGALTATSGEDRTEFLQQCARRSIFNLDGLSRRVTVHSLNVAAIRSLDDYASLQTAATSLSGRIAEIGDDSPLVTRAELAHAEALSQHIRIFHGHEIPIEFATFFNNLANWIRGFGRFQDASELHEKTLEVRERVLGPEHPDTLSSRNNLANAYQSAGRVAEAIEAHERTMERVLGPEHPDTLGSRNNLAAAYQDAGRTDEAIDAHKKTLEIRERLLGPEHPDTLSSRNNLANAYQEAGRTDEAIDLHEKTLKIRERVFVSDHPDTLKSRNNLANCYQVAGRTAEAVKVHEKTLETMERVLGPEHPDTLVSRNNLAAAQGDAGRHQQAAEVFSATLEIRERVLGPDHPDTLGTRNNLAIAYRNTNRASDADRLEQGWRPWHDDSAEDAD